MMTAESILKEVPLKNEHLAFGARMVAFGGWNMPVQYEGILAEYAATRKNAGLFDISHMGEFIIEGDPTENGLDALSTCSLCDMPVQTCRYAMMLNAKGGILDDLIVFRLENKKWMLVVNAATTETDKAHILQNLKGPSCFEDVSAQTGKLDLQGPRSREILKTFVPGIERLQYYHFDFFTIGGERALISRTGYTGELGYEIFYPAQKMKELWQKILTDDNVKPAGLGARDILRLEMGYCLYGQDLTQDISPLEAGLGNFVDLGKAFIGKEALLELKGQGVKKKLLCFSSQNRRAPRHNQKIYNDSSKEIGVVTSGTFSPALTKGIGMGFIDTSIDLAGKIFYIGSTPNALSVVLEKRPFYKNGTLKT